MRMTQNDEVQLLAGPEKLAGMPPLGVGCSVENLRITVAFSQQPQQASGEAIPNVRVEQPERGGREGVTDDRVHRPSTQPLLGDSIAVTDQCAKPGQRELNRSGVKGGAQFPSPEASAPPVMIASRDRQHHALVSQRAQRREGLECVARNHRAVLEPEIEQVAVDHQMAGDVGNDGEEATERLCRRRRRFTEMGIGHNDSGIGGHGEQYTILR